MTKKEELELTRNKFRETMERQRAAIQLPVASTVPPSEKAVESRVAQIANESTTTQESATKRKTKETTGTPERVARPSIRLTDDDLARVRDVIGYALGLSETLNITEVLRLALHEWDYKKLTSKKITDIRAQDGRRKTA